MVFDNIDSLSLLVQFCNQASLAIFFHFASICMIYVKAVFFNHYYMYGHYPNLQISLSYCINNLIHKIIFIANFNNEFYKIEMADFTHYFGGFSFRKKCHDLYYLHKIYQPCIRSLQCRFL